MSRTYSYMLPLGTKAPVFKLTNTVDGKMVSLDQIQGPKGTLIVFMCNHCPYVIHLLDGILKTAEKLLEKKIKTIAISSNSVVTHPQDGPNEMKQLAISKKFNCPITVLAKKNSRIDELCENDKHIKEVIFLDRNNNKKGRHDGIFGFFNLDTQTDQRIFCRQNIGPFQQAGNTGFANRQAT